MSNRISEIVDEIQYRQKLTHEQIANKIGYSRPYFTDALKKGTSKKLIIALEKSFPEIVQNVLSEDAPTYQQKRLQSKLNGSREDVPVYNGSTTLGNITLFSDENKEQIATLPQTVFPGCDYAEKASGDSMYPLIMNQALLVGRKCPPAGLTYCL